MQPLREIDALHPRDHAHAAAILPARAAAAGRTPATLCFSTGPQALGA